VVTEVEGGVAASAADGLLWAVTHCRVRVGFVTRSAGINLWS
jgi:hypothetical protein